MDREASLAISETEGIEGSPRTEEINEDLKKHATTTEDWKYRELIQFLHQWAVIFNQAFGLDIETPAIQIDRVRVRAIGTYRHGRNGLGLNHEITFNSRHLTGTVADILETFLHELLHEWQEIHGTSGKHNYHNLEFCAKARSIGLIVDKQGHSLGVEPGPFTELLTQYGVESMTLPIPKSQLVAIEQAPDSKMKKWSCKCTNVRAAVELEAKCLKCGELFHRAEAAW